MNSWNEDITQYVASTISTILDIIWACQEIDVQQRQKARAMVVVVIVRSF